ncbi:MAG: ubiquinol-cytochrome C chaperone family protein [Magnetospirillum sp.]|nr:ubiquinol-cytochrome C chaperone family protein [Magnetospirillum sp.]
MPFAKFFDRRRRSSIAHELYVSIINQARLPALYVDFCVPDTLDGRFDLIVLHAFLVMRRLRAIGPGDEGSESREVAQALFDLMFADMDQNLRELGVSDTSVGKRIKQMVQAFYGRASAYEECLDAGGDGDGLSDALRRNLYGTVEGDVPAGAVAAMVQYLRGQSNYLAGQDGADIVAGKVTFLSPEGFHAR